MKGLLLVVVVSLGLSQGAKLPEKWKQCPPGDGWLDCLREAVEFAITTTAKEGLPSFGVPMLDPMHFDTLLIDQSTGPVSIKLEFKDIDVTGMKDLIVNNIKGDWKEWHFDGVIPPPLSLTGGYVIQGKVLALPIVGDGKCNLTFHDFKWSPINVKFKEETKKGKRHLLIDDISLNPETSLLEMDFQNLFNGDKMLGKQMNIFLNENWPEIFGELKPAISKAFGTAYKDVGNRILSKLTAEQVTQM
ncbi:hypothetical protein GE061_003029 [Apolygus lucorum]|uniref:Uncharacterized protein n=1 Tax=Apolygus lucorum TaxID=248454 RepID=A0A6A4JDQ6_APOLU|nr:hypothetical protein GE061_003029 [Apolygus lucorum]